MRVARIAGMIILAASTSDPSADPDLLLAGSRGYGSLRAVLLGSVCGELIRPAESPVVVVP
jgi:nucleotide-binding universal stress UspA family protein